MPTAPYLKEIHAAIPRLLSLFDTNEFSPSFGMGDRQYWGWKTTDFANATYQGAAHGLSILYYHDLLPDYLSRAACLDYIAMMFHGAKTITRRDGSLEEAFPYEGSYCVTALVAYDLLSALDFVEDLNKDEHLETIEPMIDYLIQSDEHHAFISNHLTTAAAALFKWVKLFPDHSHTQRAQDKAGALLERILSHQSDEGWYDEYGGADIGYQTLAVSYLCDILHGQNDNHVLRASLEKSSNFLQYFVHPDNSIGGAYAQRNTRVIYPDGIRFLGTDDAISAAITTKISQAVAKQHVVTLSAIDSPNFIPLFNSYCRAAALDATVKEAAKSDHSLPCEIKDSFIKEFSEAGLFIYSSEKFYSVISTKKAGVLYIYDRAQEITCWDYGALYQDSAKRLYGGQVSSDAAGFVFNDEDQTLRIKSPLERITYPYPDPYKFIVLRILNVTVMRFAALREVIKRLLVSLLIDKKSKAFGVTIREIKFGDEIQIHDTVESDLTLEACKINHPFYGIHMASQGYWQRGDTQKD